MYSQIRKVVQQVTKQNSMVDEGNYEGAGSGGINFGVMSEALKQKASMSMVDELSVGKANKVDLDICLRWVDMLHRMCQALATL